MYEVEILMLSRYARGLVSTDYEKEHSFQGKVKVRFESFDNSLEVASF